LALELKHVIEGLIFAAERPLAEERLAEVLPEHSREKLAAALGELQAEYGGRGIILRRVAGGYQFLTSPELSPQVARVRRQTLRLSRAALETLAIVAYRQPLTRAQVEAIRGVDCGSLLRALVKKRLLRISGRKEAPGRPPLYATTATFLEVFDLEDLSSLPSLAEDQGLGEPFSGTANPKAAPAVPAASRTRGNP
jgi:segregation and condensation protein B